VTTSTGETLASCAHEWVEIDPGAVGPARTAIELCTRCEAVRAQDDDSNIFVPPESERRSRRSS
jgi:hypothetical protein